MTDTIRLKTQEQVVFAAANAAKPVLGTVRPPAPTVTGISPNTGTTSGNTAVTITGTNFVNVTGVKIGNTAATAITVTNSTTLHCTTPLHAAGPVSVVVTTQSGSNPTNSLFTFVAPAPAPAPSGNVTVRVGPTIAIQNSSTVLTDSQVQAAVAALQIQLDRDWQAAWGTTATLAFVSKNQAIPTGAWPLYVLDTSDYAGALGYHDETASGVPYGRIFAKDDIKYGYSWTVTLSHELLEMMLDPYVNLSVFAQDSNSSGLMYAYEACDACEADSMGYQINGVQVSDFVWPSWFDITITNPSGHRYDQMQHISQPFQLLGGGYIGVFQVPNDGSGWSSINAERVIGPPDADDVLANRDRRNRD